MPRPRLDPKAMRPTSVAAIRIRTARLAAFISTIDTPSLITRPVQAICADLGWRASWHCHTILKQFALDTRRDAKITGTRNGAVTVGMEHELHAPIELAIWRQADEKRVKGPELSIVVPTFNETKNVPLVVARLADALEGVRWEVIFVDDNSPDGTAATAREIAYGDARVRCLRRIGRRGLAGACIEGVLASSAPVVAVMDADLQHDEALLPRMLEGMRQGVELAVGTRFAGGGSASGGFSRLRHGGSQLATKAAKRLLGVALSDPMTGYFMMRRELFEALAPRLSTHGFKVLLDIVASSVKPLKIVELPYQFRARY